MGLFDLSNKQSVKTLPLMCRACCRISWTRVSSSHSENMLSKIYKTDNQFLYMFEYMAENESRYIKG